MKKELSVLFVLQGQSPQISAGCPGKERDVMRSEKNIQKAADITYTNLLTSGRLNAYLADIDRQAQERFERLLKGIKQAQSINGTAKGRKCLGMDRTAQ